MRKEYTLNVEVFLGIFTAYILHYTKYVVDRNMLQVFVKGVGSPIK